MGSFGQTVSWAVWLVFSTHHAEIPIWVRLAPRHWLRLGMDHVDGTSTLFGTQRIITGQWVRLGSRFEGDLARFLDPFPRSCHWLRLVTGLSATSEQGELASFGKAPRPESRHCGRESGHSFPRSAWECRPGRSAALCRDQPTRSVEDGIPTPSVGTRPSAIALFRNSTHQNGSVGSFGKSIRGRSRPFSRPIPPIMPLASFGKTVVGLVRGERNWLRSVSLDGRRDWLRSGKRCAVWRTSSIGTNCQ